VGLLFTISPAPDHILSRRVRVNDHEVRYAPPRDEGFAFEHPLSDESPSHSTSVYQDPQQVEDESVVSPSTVELKFEKCHIVAALKGTARDSPGNHIPLPVDWHRYFHAYCKSGCAFVSIAPSSTEPVIHVDDVRNGRIGVDVDVYLHPQLPVEEVTAMRSKLRVGAVNVGHRVYRVRVHKAEPEVFVQRLRERHDRIVQGWPSVGAPSSL